MESREHLDALLSESRDADGPERRAESIGDTGGEMPSTFAWNNDRVRTTFTDAMDGWTSSEASSKSKTCEFLTRSFTEHQILQALGSMTMLQSVQSTQTDGFMTFCLDILRHLPLQQEGDSNAAAQVPTVPVVDNPYTLHRLIIACATFTNNKDLWNTLEPSISSGNTEKALENLQMLYQTTPWSIGPDSNTSSTSSTIRGRNTIMIPGSFFDHVIQIIEKDIRPCFTHLRAQKMANRAQRTIESHQEKMRQPAPLIEDTQDSDATTGSIILMGTQGLVGQPTTGSKSSQRVQITLVQDTPDDEEDEWSELDNSSYSTGSNVLQPKRWDTTFLEAVPVVEWCAKQPIQDPSRIHEIFMLLLAPILAMTDSTQPRHRIRGLDLLTGFLIQYHDYSGWSSAGRNRRQVDPRIWIKIFERTGLDQVLERALRPLLGPLELGMSTDPEAVKASDNDALAHDDELERVNSAFRAYLTLILVNTEPNDKPASATAPSRPVTFNSAPTTGGAENTDLNLLTIEKLFLHGILGSFQRTNPSMEYRMLVLEWMEILVRPVIALDLIWVQMVQQMTLLSVIPQGSVAPSTPVQRFQGIYGMGAPTMKYLLTLVAHICTILDFSFPSSPPTMRQKSLVLARKAADALRAIIEVSKPRIPRYRGKILAALANCWANSRVFYADLETVKPSSDLSQEQLDLDQSLVSTMQLCIEFCQPKVTNQDASSGLEIDMKVLKELEPNVFDPLFAP
ncbi:hypothetical protein BGZ65_000699 [Modicella reniformis]|uniref:Uncharacterized protein n=1 Tax=Modicella reniformis TaxID=1440133 RepID=A0A9P6LT62_9FUNG|nr:hypothetical protein BGZ65_000699 [Modicella reniformis]